MLYIFRNIKNEIISYFLISQRLDIQISLRPASWPQYAHTPVTEHSVGPMDIVPSNFIFWLYFRLPLIFCVSISNILSNLFHIILF